MERDHVQLYKDAADEWRWKFVARNSEVLADSGEGYKNRFDAISALEQILDAKYDDLDGHIDVLIRNAARAARLLPVVTID